MTTTPIIAPEATSVQSTVEQQQQQQQTQQSEPQHEQPENQQLIQQQQQHEILPARESFIPSRETNFDTLETDKQLWNDIKVIYNGRDILDICSNIKNSWNIRYTYLPENNFQMYLANRSQYHRLGESYNTREYSLDICRRCYFQHPVKFQENAADNSDDIMPLVTIFPDNHHFLPIKYAGVPANTATINTPNRINAINVQQTTSNHGIGNGAIAAAVAANTIAYTNHMINNKNLKSQTPTNFFNNNTNNINSNALKTNGFNSIINNGLGNIGMGNYSNNSKNGMENPTIGSSRMNSNNNNYINTGNLTLSYPGNGALSSPSTSLSSSASAANTNIINIMNNGNTNTNNNHSNNMMSVGINSSGNGGAIPKQYPNMNRPNYNQTNMGFNATNKMPYKMYSHF